METTNETQATRLRDAVTNDHVMAMLMADRGNDAKLLSWKIRDFTEVEDDNNHSCFVVSIDVKYSEEGKEQITCYALKLDPNYISEIFDDFADDLSAEDTSSDVDVHSVRKPVYFSLGGMEEPQMTSPFDLTTGQEDTSSDVDVDSDRKHVHFSLEGLEEPQMTSSPDLITEGHVRSALDTDKGNDVHLISWEIPNSSEKDDRITWHTATVDVIFREESSIQNTSYVVKYNPGGHKERTNEVARMMFLNEIDFYINVGPELSSVLKGVGLVALRIPKCFYSTEKFGKEMMFFEDLRLKGYRKFNLGKGMDMCHATLVLKELARFHASSILLQKKNHGVDLYVELNALKENSPLNIPKEYINDMLDIGVHCILKIHNRRGGYSKAIGWLTRHKSRLFHILEKMLQRSPPFDVICHGICWDNNTLFRYDDNDKPIEAKLINLQWSRVASLATDISSFLLSSLDGGTRKQGRDVLLTIYFQTLQGALEAGDESVPFSLHELIQEYKNKQLFVMVNALTHIPLAVEGEAGVLNFLSMEGEEKDVIDDGEERREEKETEEGDKEEEVEQEALASPDEHLSLRRILALFDELQKEGLFNADFSGTGY